MKIHRTMHGILLSIGIALGIVTVGASTNAKANQLNYNDGTSQTNQNLNNDQISSGRETLINQSNYAPTTNIDQNSSSGSTNYSSMSRYPEYRSYSIDNSQNSKHYQNRQTNNQFRTHLHNRLDHVYKNILSHQEHRFYSHHRYYNNVQHHKDKAFSIHISHRRRIPIKHSHHTAHMNDNFNQSHQITGVHHHHHNWFRDGLNRRNLRARNWISWHESSHRWNVLSYGGVCVGYFQLNPHYLGYRHGHVDLRPKHQVKVADRYVRGRYGNWVNAKRFWVLHHWY